MRVRHGVLPGRVKRALSILGQSIVLCLAALSGMLFLHKLIPSLHVVHVIAQQGLIRRQYEFDWLFSVAITYCVFLLVGLITRRLRTSWIASTAAFLLTILIIVVFTKVGFKEIDLLYGPN